VCLAVHVGGAPPASGSSYLAIVGRGMLRTFARAKSIILPTPPSRTVLPADSAKPLTCAAVMWGGVDSAFGSVRRSISAGPGCASPGQTSMCQLTCDGGLVRHRVG
jgi:hypothetical protein